jgi:hypothetical protein
VSEQQRRQDQPRERAAYVTLVGLFLGVFAAFSRREKDEREPLRLAPLDLALLGLATFRGGRIAAYDRVTEPLRAPVTETQPDEYGASENVVAAGSGVRKAIGELVSCPTCVGTWIAAGLVYGLRIAPRPNEALSWSGKAQRKASAPE